MWISIDKQTIGFKGRHKDILCISYKREGDGFQCDAICDDGFTYQFYFRNEQPPPQYAHLLPLFARVMALFDILQDNFHRVGCNNLYVSAKLCKISYMYPQKVLIHGVCRAHNRGFQEITLQQEVTVPEHLGKLRGTVKGTILTGDDDLENLILIYISL